MNINVQPLELLGKRWGLEFLSSSSMCDDPFGINIDIYGDNIKWTVYYDARFIEPEVASSLLKEMQEAFFIIVDANRHPGLTVRDVLKSIKGSG
jgi:hypothetical protein